jgi:hypothetical protein
MSEHAQIDIRKGKQIVRIHHGWGVPRQVIATLRKVGGMGCFGVRSVANKYMKHVPDASFGLELIPGHPPTVQSRRTSPVPTRSK